MVSPSGSFTPPCLMISTILLIRCWFVPIRPVTPFMIMPILCSMFSMLSDEGCPMSDVVKFNPEVEISDALVFGLLAYNIGHLANFNCDNTVLQCDPETRAGRLPTSGRRRSRLRYSRQILPPLPIREFFVSECSLRPSIPDHSGSQR